MRRFYLPPPDCRADHLVLTGSEAHHAADVLRVKSGDEVAVLDGVGSELACRVESVARVGEELPVTLLNGSAQVNPEARTDKRWVPLIW